MKPLFSSAILDTEIGSRGKELSIISVRDLKCWAVLRPGLAVIIYPGCRNI